MEQHPVPQHIASFEFKLFGNLTVRQFVTLLIPLSLAAAIYFSTLPAVIRIPLAGLLGLFAFFAALVPVGGRPLDKWVVAFIKAVLAPTQRIWIKEEKIPEYLSVVVKETPPAQKVPQEISQISRERLKNYLRSLPRGQASPLDTREQIALERLGLEAIPSTALAHGGRLPPAIIWPSTQGPPPQIEKGPPTFAPPKGEPEEYAEKMRQSLPETAQIAHRAPRIPQHAKPFALPGLEKKLKAQTIQKAQIHPRIKAQLASEANFTIESVIPIRTPGQRFRLIHGLGKIRARKLHFAPPEGFDLSKLPIRGERRFEISKELKKQFAKDTEALFTQEAPRTVTKPEVILPKAATQTVKAQKTQTKKAATVKKYGYIPKIKRTTEKAADVSFKKPENSVMDQKIAIHTKSTIPPLPTEDLKHAQIIPLTAAPNVISGIVFDNQNNPLERVILVIKDQNGIPVRALKTNKLGQFLSATPLSNGTYTIEIESDAQHFIKITLNLTGKVLAPLEIKAES